MSAIDDDHVPAPLEHTPEVEAIVDHDSMAVYEPDNMEEAWLNSDTVVEVVE